MVIMHLSGTSFCQNAIKKSKEDDKVVLVADKTNAFDKNAVEIINLRTNEKIGFVSKKYNADVCKKLSYKTHTGTIKKIVGTDIFGVIIDVAWRYADEAAPRDVQRDN